MDANDESGLALSLIADALLKMIEHAVGNEFNVAVVVYPAEGPMVVGVCNSGQMSRFLQAVEVMRPESMGGHTSRKVPDA